MNGEQIYHSLCKARSLDAAVSRLSRAQLAEVAAHLGGMHPSGGVPAQVWGMVAARLSTPPKTARRARKTTLSS